MVRFLLFGNQSDRLNRVLFKKILTKVNDSIFNFKSKENLGFSGDSPVFLITATKAKREVYEVFAWPKNRSL